MSLSTSDPNRTESPATLKSTFHDLPDPDSSLIFPDLWGWAKAGHRGQDSSSRLLPPAPSREVSSPTFGEQGQDPKARSRRGSGDMSGLLCNLLISCSWLMGSEANKGTLQGKQEVRALRVSLIPAVKDCSATLSLPHHLGQFYLVVTVTCIHPASEIPPHLLTPNPSFLFLANAKSLKICNRNLLSCNLKPSFLVLFTMKVKNMVHSSLASTFTYYLGNALKFLFRRYFSTLVGIQTPARAHCICIEEEKLLYNLQGSTARHLQKVWIGKKKLKAIEISFFFFPYFEISLQVPRRVWPHRATAVQ